MFDFLSDMDLWKLNTVTDYLMFIGAIAAGLLVFAVIARYYGGLRDQNKAVKRVNKRLKMLAKKPSQIYENVTLRLPDGNQTFDGVLLDRSGIFLIKTYGWGLKISGTPDGETWKRTDREREERFPNPLIDLKKGVEGVQKVLEDKGIHKVKVMPMVVFADTMDTPQLYLGYGSYSTIYQEMKNWYMKQSGVSTVQYDFERVHAVMKNEVIINK
ncbi:MAG: NERD domain-containing protein [Lachnospiraceae bacterium]|nr:NERD domain-containing protein [Lachnospiraceae bacterium]